MVEQTPEWRTRATGATLVFIALVIGYVAAWAVTETPPDIIEILFGVPELTADPTVIFAEFAPVAVWFIATVLAVVALAGCRLGVARLRQRMT